jgi:uncharacterized RDD family membrane protein YckC
MTDTNPRPGLLRLLMVMLYDVLLLLSALLLSTVIPVVLNQGQAIEPGNPIFLLYLLMVSLFFYGWFWTHGGQTLGMRAWKVYLVGQSQVEISWQQATMRFAVAIISWLCLGLGFFWQWLSKDKLSWHDLLSGTQLIVHKPDEKSSAKKSG